MTSLKQGLSSTLMILFLFTSCKDNPKKEKKKSTLETDHKLIVNQDKSTINWTAYKTTEKLPVKGTFKTLKIKNATPASSIEKAFDGLQVSIPVTSVFTNEEDRDNKLKHFFFGVMDYTELLSGTFHMRGDGSCVFSLLMNNETHDLPLKYKVNSDEHKVTFSGKLILDDWKALKALESINKTCYDLHKGSDGVSKTWNEVDIEAVGYVDEITTTN